MNTPLITVSAIITLAVLFVLLPLIVHTFQLYRKKRVLKCPESGGLAEVDIDASRAAFSSAFGKSLLRIKNCTLWPKKKGCSEGCLK
ncbi:MAG: hypothetical protein IH857_06455 [Deltaproteobacteria bacterium]|nr:hypothetical protein [Deltaproteobacteria bacterium]